MKSNDVRAQFIELRAEGYSYSKITELLHISKATCSKWQAEYENEIISREQERIKELCDIYKISKEARIESLAQTLQQINESLDVWGGCIDLTPEQLLNYKIKYEQAIKEELPAQYEPVISECTQQEILSLKADVYNRLRAGILTHKQALIEINILNDIQPLIAN